MPSSSFWFFSLVGTPILAYSSKNEYTFTNIFVVLTVELLRGCCSGCSDEYPLYEATPYHASSYRATPYKATPYKATPYQAPPYQASPYQASPYQEPFYQVPSPINPKATSPTPVSLFEYNLLYTPSPPEYDDYYYTSCDDFRARYEENYSRYNDPPPTYNNPKPSPLPSSVYGHSPTSQRIADRNYTNTSDDTQWVARAHRGQRIWGSGSICVRVLVNSNDEYQTIIHAQQCNVCNQFVKPDIDEDVYAERIVGALDFWTGRSRREARNTDFSRRVLMTLNGAMVVRKEFVLDERRLPLLQQASGNINNNK